MSYLAAAWQGRRICTSNRNLQSAPQNKVLLFTSPFHSSINFNWNHMFQSNSSLYISKILPIGTNSETKWSWPPSQRRCLMFQSFLFAATIKLKFNLKNISNTIHYNQLSLNSNKESQIVFSNKQATRSHQLYLVYPDWYIHMYCIPPAEPVIEPTVT